MASNQLIVYDHVGGKWNNFGLGTTNQVLTTDTTVATTNLKWSTPTTGTVTSVAAGTGLTASPSPIVGSGTLSITNTSVTAGSYVIPNITINQQGQITAAANAKGVTYTNGTVTLAGSTATVTDANITTTSVITLSYVSPTDQSVMGSLYSVPSAGSATINSNHALDVNMVNYVIWY